MSALTLLSYSVGQRSDSDSAQLGAHPMAGAAVRGDDDGRGDVLCDRAGVLVHAGAGQHEVRAAVSLASHGGFREPHCGTHRGRQLFGCAGDWQFFPPKYDYVITIVSLRFHKIHKKKIAKKNNTTVPTILQSKMIYITYYNVIRHYKELI